MYNYKIIITGFLIEKTNEQLLIDWFGGNKININKLKTIGNWDQLKIGQWFKAVLLRNNNEIINIKFIKIIDAPKSYSAEELEKKYKTIPIAKLTPMDDEKKIIKRN